MADVDKEQNKEIVVKKVLDRMVSWIKRRHGFEIEKPRAEISTAHTTTKLDTQKAGAVIDASTGTAQAYAGFSTFDSEGTVGIESKNKLFGIALRGNVKKDDSLVQVGVENFTAKVGASYSTNSVEGAVKIKILGVGIELSAGIGIGVGAGAEVGVTGVSAEAGMLVKASVGVKLVEIPLPKKKEEKSE